MMVKRGIPKDEMQGWLKRVAAGSTWCFTHDILYYVKNPICMYVRILKVIYQ